MIELNDEQKAEDIKTRILKLREAVVNLSKELQVDIVPEINYLPQGIQAVISLRDLKYQNDNKNNEQK